LKPTIAVTVAITVAIAIAIAVTIAVTTTAARARPAAVATTIGARPTIVTAFRQGDDGFDRDHAEIGIILLAMSPIGNFDAVMSRFQDVEGGAVWVSFIHWAVTAETVRMSLH
jgi:hypothetical protein